MLTPRRIASLRSSLRVYLGGRRCASLPLADGSGGTHCHRGAVRLPRTMKDFHCRDAGTSCDFVARGNSNQEILDQVGQHARAQHNMQMTPEMSRTVEGL